MNNIIYYFSGTGNCLALSKKLKDNNTTLIRITNEAISNFNIVCDNCYIIYPTYAYGCPKIVRTFLKSLNITCNYLSIITTYGSLTGGSLSYVKKILRKRKIKVNSCYKVKSVENFIPLFGFKSNKLINKRLEKQNKLTEKLIINLKNKKSNKVFSFRPFSRLVLYLFYTFGGVLIKKVKANSNCNKCRLCIKICPVNSISLKNDLIKINHKKCNQCQACFNFCPQKALSYGRINKNGLRYNHPDVVVEEFIK